MSYPPVSSEDRRSRLGRSYAAAVASVVLAVRPTEPQRLCTHR
jgi:hypothetical protein